jgi:hypothetical protein
LFTCCSNLCIHRSAPRCDVAHRSVAHHGTTLGARTREGTRGRHAPVHCATYLERAVPWEILTGQRQTRILPSMRLCHALYSRNTLLPPLLNEVASGPRHGRLIKGEAVQMSRRPRHTVMDMLQHPYTARPEKLELSLAEHSDLDRDAAATMRTPFYPVVLVLMLPVQGITGASVSMIFWLEVPFSSR